MVDRHLISMSSDAMLAGVGINSGVSASVLSAG
jgi:hypothetical protein